MCGSAAAEKKSGDACVESEETQDYVMERRSYG